MHIATFIPTGELIGIDKSDKGRNCHCKCYSCQGELVAKQGESNQWHFAHYKNSKKQCDYSFWVVCRDLAKQIFFSKVYPINTIAISHQIGSKEISRISFEDTKIDDITFDLSFYAKDIGHIFVYFLTPEYNRNQFSRMDTFSENVLLVNLIDAINQKQNITEYLYQTIIDSSDAKIFLGKRKVLPIAKQMNSLFDEIEQEEKQEKLKQEIMTNIPNLSNYKAHIFLSMLKQPKLEINTHDLSLKDIACINSLDKIFLSFIQNYGYNHNKSYIFKEIANNGGKVYFVSCNDQFLGYAIFENKYVVFVPRNNSIEPIMSTPFRDSIPRIIRKFLS